MDELLIGYVARAVKEGELADVVVKQFLSSEDGDFFISRLEGLVSPILQKLPEPTNIGPSIIDHFLAVLHPDKSAVVYVNELNISVNVILKRAVEKGEVVFQNDIADITGVNLGGIEIPECSGIIFVFSSGWRKGLYFDFAPLSSNYLPRDYSLESQLAGFYAYLSNQQLFAATRSDWEALLRHKWFPFISLQKQTISLMLENARNDFFSQAFTDLVSMELEEMLDKMVLAWEKHSAFQEHYHFINHAVERFRDKDYLSVTAILFPRIEGVMRNFHLLADPKRKAHKDNLLNSLLTARHKEIQPFSLLLPNAFRQFLDAIYFANSQAEISRHSVAHGVAKHKEFSKKSAVTAFLILDQMRFFLPSK